MSTTPSTKEFDERVEKVVPAVFVTISSASEGEQSEESYNVSKVFPHLPNKAAYGNTGSVCTSAFLQHEYLRYQAGNNHKPQKLVETLKDMRRTLQDHKFYQTPLVGSSRPIEAATTTLQICPPGETSCSMKRALLIGISYRGCAGCDPLRSSHADCLRIRDMLIEVHGFEPENMCLLLDDNSPQHLPPTKRNIEDGLLRLARDSQPGDVNFVAFSGHGGQIRDREGDEEGGYDSNIFPVDFQEAGYILDDDLLTMLVKPLKKGVTTTALFDCCHSANIFDLPYSFRSDATEMQRKKGFNMESVTEAIRPLTAQEKAKERYRRKKKKEKAERAARVAETEQQETLGTISAVDGAQVPTTVTRNGLGQVIITGNPTPEELMAIQNQMIQEAQEAAAKLSLSGGQRAQITVIPGGVVLPATQQNITPQGLTQRAVTVKSPALPTTIFHAKTPNEPGSLAKSKVVTEKRNGNTKPAPSPALIPSYKPKKNEQSTKALSATLKKTDNISPAESDNNHAALQKQSNADSPIKTPLPVPSESETKEKEKRAPVQKNGTNAVYYSADDLRQERVPGLDYTKREMYLSSTEFHSIFGMSYSEFELLPPWKRTNLKRENRLF